MSMHQMKRAEVSGWKHYKKVIQKKKCWKRKVKKCHKRESFFEAWWRKDTAVKRLNAKRQSTDFPTNIRECVRLILIFAFALLHKEACGSDTLSRTEPVLCLPSSLGEARPSALHSVCLPLPGGKSRSSRGYVKSCRYQTFDVYRKLHLILILSIYLLPATFQILVKHFFR